MDIIEFYTTRNEFKIRLKRESRFYIISEFSKYKCTIEFINSINQVVLSIETDEKGIFNFIQNLNEFIINFENVYSDNLWFSENHNFNNFFIYLSVKEPDYFIEDNENDLYINQNFLTLSLFQSSEKGNILRLYFETSYEFLENMMYNFFLLIEDIPYLNDMSNSSLLNFTYGE